MGRVRSRGRAIRDGSVALHGGARAKLPALAELEPHLFPNGIRQTWPAPGDHRVYDEGAVVDQPRRGERRRNLHAAEQDSPPGQLRQTANGVGEVAVKQLGVPANGGESRGCHVLGHRVDDRGERHVAGIHPIRPFSRLGPPPPVPHHLVGDTAVEQGDEAGEFFGPERHGFGVGREAGFVVDAVVEGGVGAVAEGLGHGGVPPVGGPPPETDGGLIVRLCAPAPAPGPRLRALGRALRADARRSWPAAIHR